MISHLLKVASKVVYRRQRELILVSVRELLVIRHELVLVEQLVRNVEEQTVLERALGPLFCGLLGLPVVHAGVGVWRRGRRTCFFV